MKALKAISDVPFLQGDPSAGSDPLLDLLVTELHTKATVNCSLFPDPEDPIHLEYAKPKYKRATGVFSREKVAARKQQRKAFRANIRGLDLSDPEDNEDEDSSEEEIVH